MHFHRQRGAMTEKRVGRAAVRLLIADDSSAIRRRIRRLVETITGAVVVAEAETAAEAVSRSLAHRPDVVVLDIEMPGSGISVLRRLRAHLPETEFVMLTNHAEAYFKRICEREGADRFLDKSREFDQLGRLIEALEVRRGVHRRTNNDNDRRRMPT